MNKVYYLKTCSTCQRILGELPSNNLELQNIKTELINESQIDEMHNLAGSYESLFSRKAMKYRAMGLHEKELLEQDYRSLILEEYTFLKRPVFLIDGEIFIGNAKKVVEQVKEKLS
ncbi:MAG: arsenate reductase [Sphingobacteriales bacterium]|jgi:arsenate reductase